MVFKLKDYVANALRARSYNINPMGVISENFYRLKHTDDESLSFFYMKLCEVMPQNWEVLELYLMYLDREVVEKFSFEDWAKAKRMEEQQGNRLRASIIALLRGEIFLVNPLEVISQNIEKLRCTSNDALEYFYNHIKLRKFKSFYEATAFLFYMDKEMARGAVPY